MKKLCLFCGSSAGKNTVYAEEARALGQKLAEGGAGLVYGGASIGVMGAAADGALERGGEVIGVIPKSLVEWEVAHAGLTELKVTPGMHERKILMYDISDAFVAMPGGFGTLDELCEILTWAQLQYHQKPIYLLNTNSFFDSLLDHFKKVNQEGFVSDEHLALLKVFPDKESLLEDFFSLAN